MLYFAAWLLEEEQGFIPPEVLKSYEFAFRDELNKLIGRTQDPVLRAKFIEMLNCPIRTSRGCRSFTNYILGALFKNNIHNRYDMESVLSYVFEKMMMPTTASGEEKGTVFGGFDERVPYAPGGNPLQARFMKFLQFAVNNVRKNKVPRLALQAPRPPGTVAIGLGRQKQGDPAAVISPEAIPSRLSSEEEFQEMVGSIRGMLLKQEPATGLPLVRFFDAIMAGQRTVEQVRLFGRNQTTKMWGILKQTLRQYADSTGNYTLLNLLQRYEGIQGNRPMPAARVAPKVVKPVLTDQQRDYASIINVIDKLGGRPAGSADLGKYRRRWLEYPPRDASSGYPNRLQEVLTRMVQDGVLKATRTAKGALVYSPGPNYEQYRQPAA